MPRMPGRQNRRQGFTFGESGAILDLLTRDHGRHAGLVRGGASRRIKPTLQPGNSVHVQWRARLEEHLGSFICELARARADLRRVGRWGRPERVRGPHTFGTGAANL